MNESTHFAYKTDGIEIDLKALADQLTPANFLLVCEKVVTPLVGEIAALRELVGGNAEAVVSQAERIETLETQQATNATNLERLFSAHFATRERVETLENAPDKPGPGTINQQEQIAAYLKKSPKKRAAFGELRDFLGVTASRFSQIIKGAEFIILLNRRDKRRRLLQLPAKF